MDKLNTEEGFNGHPPLGVNATLIRSVMYHVSKPFGVSMGTHPWG